MSDSSSMLVATGCIRSSFPALGAEGTAFNPEVSQNTGTPLAIMRLWGKGTATYLKLGQDDSCQVSDLFRMNPLLDRPIFNNMTSL